jgi:hypothetical protein
MDPSPSAASLRAGAVVLLLAVLGTLLAWGSGTGFLTVLGLAGGASILLGWIAWRERRRALLWAALACLALVGLRAWLFSLRLNPPRYADYFPEQQATPLQEWNGMNGAWLWFGSAGALLIAMGLAFVWAARAAVGTPGRRLVPREAGA